MSIAAVADKAAAVFRRDLLSAARYRLAFLVTTLGSIAELAAFYYLARAIGPEFRPEGFDYFPFLLVGTGLYTFLIMSIQSFLQSVQEAQQTGTLEVLMTTSTPPAILVLLSAISTFSRNIAQFVLYVTAGLLISRASMPRPNFVALFVVLLLCILIAVAIGMMTAALQIAIQKGAAVLWILGSGAWLFTGTLFPVSTLPTPLHAIAEIVPITHALSAMRLALLERAKFVALGREISVLVAFCVILLPLGFAMFSYALQNARQEGTLSCY
jgi:ABC-2 type transport system permease protein